MMKMATAKKATKTAPVSNCANPMLAPDNPRLRTPMQTGSDMAQPMPCHSEKTPGGSQPAAATKPCTRGDLRMSRCLVCEHLAQAVIARSQAADHLCDTLYLTN